VNARTFNGAEILEDFKKIDKFLEDNKVRFTIEYFDGNLIWECSNKNVKYPNFIVRFLIKHLMLGKVYKGEHCGKDSRVPEKE
jgi:hypothetical protein